VTIEIRDFPHPHANGIGLSFNFIIWQMLRHAGSRLWVNIDKPNSPYRESARGPNPWDYYFLQDAPESPTTLALVENPLDLPLSGHRDWTMERQRAISAFARQHIRLRPEIQAEVDSFKAQFFRGKVLAVHLRGTDKLEEYRPMRDEEILHEVRALKERVGAETVFLMTDDVRYHKLITEGVGAVSVTMVRGARSLHHNPPRGPYMSGLWMVLDGFIAADAHAFAYTPSNAATIPLIMGGHFESIHRINRYCVIEPFCQRVDRRLGLVDEKPRET
jgi:uncharacterized protein YerC